MHGTMCAPLVIGAKNMLSISFGMALAFSLDGTKGLRHCLDMRKALKVLPVAGSFCAAQIFALHALRVFDAGSLKVIAQVNLPTTALLSWVVLGRRYSAGQWLSMMLLLVCTTAFLQVRMLFFDPPGDREGSNFPTPDKVIGMFMFLAGIALSCFASIFAERFLKKRYEIPFYIQKTNLMIGELILAGVMVHVNLGSGDSVHACSWEQIRAWWQLPVVLLWFIHGWMAGLLVKRCSAIIKNISHIISALVTYFFPLLVFSSEQGKHRWPVTLSAMMVLIAVLLFATLPQPPQPPQRPSASLRKKSKNTKEKVLVRSSSEVALRDLRNRQKYRDSQEQSKRQEVFAPKTAFEVCRCASDGIDDKKAEEIAQAFPRTPRRQAFWILVLFFILLDATKPLLVTWATARKPPEERFILSTFILVQTFVSLLVGLTFAAGPHIVWPCCFRLHPEWRFRIRRCLEPSGVLARLPVSGCLCTSKLLLIMALGRLDAGTVRVFCQASLPLVGVSSHLFFSKRYTAQQWCSLVAISVALITFYYVKAEVQRKGVAADGPETQSWEVVGVLCVLGAIGFNCLGALWVEKFLKGNQSRLHVQKAQLLVGEIIVNIGILFVMPLMQPTARLRAAHSPWVRGFFAGWDGRVLLCVIIWIPAGWTTTTLIKQCSGMVKTIAQSTSSVLTYVFTIFPMSYGPRFWTYLVTLLGPPLQPEPVSCPVVLLAVAVMISAITFGIDNAPKTRDEDGVKGAVPASVAKWMVDPSYRLALPPRPAADAAADP